MCERPYFAATSISSRYPSITRCTRSLGIGTIVRVWSQALPPLIPVLGEWLCIKFLGEIGYTPCMIKNLDKDELIKRIERLRSNNPMSKIDEEEINARKHAFWG